MNASGHDVDDVDDDELDTRLRELFADTRLDVVPLPRVEEEIVAGARRRRRRRATLTGSGGALAVVAVAVAGFAVLGSRTPGEGDGTAVAVSPDPRETYSAPMLTAPSRDDDTGSDEMPQDPGAESVDSDSAVPPDQPVPQTSTPPQSDSVTMASAVLDSTGYGRLELGMPFREAVETDLLMVEGESPPPKRCADYPLVEGDAAVKNVTISAEHGLVAITAEGAMTPDGVGVGSPADDVEDRYPAGSGDETAFNVDVGAGKYEFTISDGTVSGLRLVAHTYDC
ncbi:hypothetical protein [Saccharomonospora sp.]|uniref:hypothetical protein n=1 Tax=Saccharomonospora sp. TaxID=33913 RepID=UPI00260F8A3A|nr:hypothetical protein [Saccharomonospora sp.]